jgi:hypothetical protein
MAEPRNDKEYPPHYDDTMKPSNPPRSLLSRSTRRKVVLTYVGPIIALFVVIALGFGYWYHRTSSATPSSERTYAVGTTGEVGGDNGYKYGYEPGSTPGGYDPQDVVGHRDNTASELHRRGANGRSDGPNPPLFGNQPLTTLGAILQDPHDVVGRPVDVRNVAIDSAEGTMFWIRQDDMKVEVMAPAGASAMRPGMRVHVVGTVEQGPGGRSVIRASRVDVTKK